MLLSLLPLGCSHTGRVRGTCCLETCACLFQLLLTVPHHKVLYFRVERNLLVSFRKKVSSGIPDPAPLNNLSLLCIALRHSS